MRKKEVVKPKLLCEMDDNKEGMGRKYDLSSFLEFVHRLSPETSSLDIKAIVELEAYVYTAEPFHFIVNAKNNSAEMAKAGRTITIDAGYVPLWRMDYDAVNPSGFYSANPCKRILLENFLWFAPDGSAWTTKVRITVEFAFDEAEKRAYVEKANWNRESIWEMLPGLVPCCYWEECNLRAQNNVIVNTKDEIKGILNSVNPYAAALPIPPENLLMAPQLEQLYKAGYKIAESSFRWWKKQAFDAFKRTIKPGSSLKTIIQMPRSVYSQLKDEKDILVWDSMRKTAKLSSDPAGVGELYTFVKTRILEIKDVENLRKIQRAEYHGKVLFPRWHTLLTYLDHIDMYEAISAQEGIPLLFDYIHCCQTIDIKPNLSSDSLKREHDVAARLCLQKRNAKISEGIANAEKTLRKYNYEERNFLIRAVKDQEDLIAEAQMQHNCVASYGDFIAHGVSEIFVMRETSNPDRSLATVELEPSHDKICQSFLSYNRPITSAAQNAFLKRWLKRVQEIDATKTA